MKQKTPPVKGGASEIRLSLQDKSESEATRQDLQVVWIAKRFLFSSERARVISELAFGAGGRQ